MCSYCCGALIWGMYACEKNILLTHRAQRGRSCREVVHLSSHYLHVYVEAKFIGKHRLRAVIEKALELDKLEENLATIKEAHHTTMDDLVLIELDERSDTKSLLLGAEAMVLSLTVKVFAINTSFTNVVDVLLLVLVIGGECSLPRSILLTSPSRCTASN